MISARMDRRITIQQPTVSYNDYNEQITSWSTFATVWANVKRQSAREIWAAGKTAEVDAVFTIRYMSGIDETFRIVFDSENYEITGAPRELGRQDGLEIMGQLQK